MSPKVTPKPMEARSSYAEFRSRSQIVKNDLSLSTDVRGDVFWSYMTAPSWSLVDEFGRNRPATVGDVELRVLSKATNAAGGYTVPTDLESSISTVRRSRAVIGNLARQIVTDTGDTLLMGTATTHGTATRRRNGDENAATPGSHSGASGRRSQRRRLSLRTRLAML